MTAMSETSETKHRDGSTQQREVAARALDLETAAEFVRAHARLFPASNNIICLLDAERRCVAVNGAFLAAFGKHEEEIIGQGPGDPGGRDTFGSLIAETPGGDSEGEPLSVQRWWDFPSWGFRFVQLDLEPIHDEGGVILGTVVRAEDMSDAKLAQNALEESERRFEDFAEVTPHWIWELDSALRFVYLSSRFEEVMGMAPGDALGRKRTEIFPEEDYAAPGTRRHYRDLEQRRAFRGYQFTRRRPDGETRVIRLSGKPIFDEQGRFHGYRGIAEDASEAHRRENRITHLTCHDTLTGLVNRTEFESRLRRVLETARIDESEHGLCYLDLDEFRTINEHCGHSAGDMLLERLANLLRSKVRRRDTLARVGGDEFAILMEHCSLTQLERVAESVASAVSEFHYTWQDESFSISASVAVVPIRSDMRTIDDALAAADRACYAAKNDGGGCIRVYGETNEIATP
jgi:diguanylate cyclase (GGDEF)-like protein/PAS domain S-box-containing protein